ncbi:MAG: hypothetical protein P4M00_19865 [Azospirillaceae bacterium]|nr:hypothetical protein [Azospirillaceae bacterium]
MRRWLSGLLLLALIATATTGLIDRAGDALGYPSLFAVAKSHNQQVLHRAVTLFGTARIINSTLSVVSSARIEGSVPLIGGAGASIGPGRLVDPLDALIEQFGTLMLAAAAAAAATAILLEIGAGWGLAVLVPGGLVLVLAGVLLRNNAAAGGVASGLERAGRGVTLIGLLLKLGLPLAIIVTGIIGTRFLDPAYSPAEIALTRLAQQPAPAAPDQAGASTGPGDTANQTGGVLAWIGRQVGGGIDPAVVAQPSNVLERLGTLFENVVDLVAVFALQTVILPLGLIFGLWRLLRVMVAGR